MDLITTLMVGATVIGVLYLLFGGKKKNLPPSPPGALPLVGHMLQIDHSRPTHDTMGIWAEKYGPIFGMYLGRSYLVLLNDPKLIRDTLNDTSMSDRPNNKVFKAVAGGGNHGILFADGQTWTEQRRFTLRHLREFGFGKNVMETLILDEARDLVDGFKPDVGKSISGLGRRFSLAVLSSLWLIISGERLNHDDQEMKSILEDVFRQLDVVFVERAVAFLPELATLFPEWSGFNALTRAVDRANNYLRPYIVKHEETMVDGAPRDLIDSYLDEMKKAKGSGSSFYKEEGYKNLLAVITDLFGAGAETTSTTLDWAVLYLATYPHFQKDLQAEIDTVIGHDRLPSLADKPSMPFTEALMMEVMRYSSIAALGLFRVTQGDTKIGGYDVPKGAMIIPNLIFVHHNPAIWDKPEEFNPARFLSADGKTVVKNDALMPFSVGKRVCIGETLARDEFFLFLTCLFQRYSIELDSSKPPSAGAAPRKTFILKPHPYHVIMRERAH